MDTFLEVVLPAIVINTMLFGLLSRGNPRPGGVALFWRVGLVGTALGGVMWFLAFKTRALVSMPAFVRNCYAGLLVAGALLTLFALLGTLLKRKPT